MIETAVMILAFVIGLFTLGLPAWIHVRWHMQRRADDETNE